MPALSQSLTFTVNSTSTVSLNYPNTGTTALSYTSSRIRADGFYGSSDGFHTAQIKLTNFKGKIEIQGTLVSAPVEADWTAISLSPVGTKVLRIDTTGLITDASVKNVTYTTATTIVTTYNFTGNYVWLRTKVSDFTEGSINSVQINH